MNDHNISPKPSGPKKSASAVGIILTIVCIPSGLYASIQLAKIFPVWLAVIVAAVLGLLVVSSMTASLGNELQDVLIGCVTVIFVMAVMVTAGVKAYQKHHPAPVTVEQPKVSVWPASRQT
jgi:hypothetical protein